MSCFPLMPSIPPSGGKSVTYVSRAEDATDLTTYSFTGLDFGAPTSDRVLIALIRGTGTASRTVNSVSIGGVSATLYENVSRTNPGCIAVASVPSGTSGTVSVTFSGACLRAGVGLFRAVGLNSSVPTSTTSLTFSFTSTFTIPAFVTPASGFSVFGVVSGRSDTPSITGATLVGGNAVYLESALGWVYAIDDVPQTLDRVFTYGGSTGGAAQAAAFA